jgi:single-strand DNA-binding protein
MIDTRVTVVGNVATAPQRVRLQHGPVTNFRLAATERRFDSTAQAWVDGATLWCDVECFDELGTHVSSSISKGDPVIVVGSMTTRSWEGEKGRGSTAQIRASAVGPNLRKGTADFKRAARPAVDSAPSPEEMAPPEESEPREESALSDYSAEAPSYELDVESSLEPALS